LAKYYFESKFLILLHCAPPHSHVSQGNALNRALQPKRTRSSSSSTLQPRQRYLPIRILHGVLYYRPMPVHADLESCSLNIKKTGNELSHMRATH